MIQLTAGLKCEIIKLRRSKIFWITIGMFIFIPLMMGLLIYVAQNPEISAKLGIIGTKATLFGENDWKGFLTILNQSIASIGLIGFGFVIAWVFGREYTEKTIVDILALPASRSSIVMSKFIIIFLWSLVLSVLLFSAGILTGILIELPGLTEKIIYHNLKIFFITAGMTFLVCTPAAFFASYGKGVMAPIGFVIICLILANFLGLIGLGPYFPWAIPGAFTVPEGTEGMKIVRASYIIVFITALLGIFSTIIWWRKADQH